jgi:hypothetical protein
MSGARLELLEDAAPRRHTDLVALTGLDDRELRAFVRAMAPPEQMGVLLDAIGSLQSATGGNPLFLRELFRELDDHPSAGSDPLELERTLGTLAPVGVRELVDRRVERLSAAGRQLVEAAAVIARDISLDAITAACRLTGLTVHDGLEECLATRLIVEDEHVVGRYQFPHDVVRNAVATTIPVSRRSVVHRRLARHLEQSADEIEPAVLAHHFGAAGPTCAAKAALYAHRAGDDAARRFAFADAAHWYERAAEGYEGASAQHPELGRLMLALGRAFENDQQRDRAEWAFVRAAELAAAGNDSSLLVDAALALLGPWSSGSAREPIALALLRAALAELAPEDSLRRVEVLNGIATALYLVDPNEEGSVAAAAVEIAARLDDRRALALARLATHRWLTHQPAACGERLAAAQSAKSLLDDPSGSSELWLRIQREVLADLLENGEFHNFAAELDRYETASTRFGSPRNIYWSMALRATQACMVGDLGLAEQLARGASLRGHELEQNSSGAYLLQRFVVRFQQGRLAEELGVLAHADAAPDTFRAGAALLAVARCETGELNAAREVLRSTIADRETPLRHDVLWLGAAALFAAVAANTGGAEEIDTLLEWLTPCADQIVVFGTGAAVLGPVRLWLGLLTAARGDCDTAVTHFVAASERAKTLGMAYWEADAQLAMAITLERRGRAVDSGDAARLRAGALATARAGGYGQLEQRAQRAAG